MYLCIYVSMYLSLDILYYNILYYIISLQLLHIPFSTSRSSSFSSIEDCPPRYFIFVFVFLYSCILSSHLLILILNLGFFSFSPSSSPPIYPSIHPPPSNKQTHNLSYLTHHFSLLTSFITNHLITYHLLDTHYTLHTARNPKLPASQRRNTHLHKSRFHNRCVVLWCFDIGNAMGQDGME